MADAVLAGQLEPRSLKDLVDDYERRLIVEALVRAGGNQRRAAADLGCLATTLNEKMRRLGLRPAARPARFVYSFGRPAE